MPHSLPKPESKFQTGKLCKPHAQINMQIRIRILTHQIKTQTIRGKVTSDSNVNEKFNRCPMAWKTCMNISKRGRERKMKLNTLPALPYAELCLSYPSNNAI